VATGFLMLLMATAPPLSRRARSVLYIDIATMSLLAGLAPMGYFLRHIADAIGIKAVTRLTTPHIPRR
jgi:hypothetical protein